MKQKFFFLVAILGLIIVVGAVIHYLGTRGPKIGELRVESQPDASIFLDDKNIGKTPFRDKIDVGDYTLKLVPNSTTSQLNSWEGKVSVGQNLLTYVNANLSESDLTTAVDEVWLEKITSKTSELSVTTNPDGATVLVDDVIKGVTPLSLQDITTGDHDISITNTGFLTRTLKIKTTPGYRLIASFKLALSPGSPTPDTGIAASSSATPVSNALPSSSNASSSASQQPDPPKPFVIIKDTPTGFLRVRMDASVSASEAARVNPGDKFTIVDDKNGWYEIKYDGTNTGWVSGQYTEKVQ
ncbi:MAG TPA: PEGA domain-containing protein [Patescibacteria group bacterium]|nr:PEGA domain-containing protein [Patescibacteria group bacterium]